MCLGNSHTCLCENSTHAEQGVIFLKQTILTKYFINIQKSKPLFYGNLDTQTFFRIIFAYFIVTASK